MAKLAIKINDEISTVELSKNASGSTMDTVEAANNQDSTIHNMIDENLEIKDPGFLDLSQISALSEVQPNAPGSYIIPAQPVTFSASEKATLEEIIKKLASVCHTHSMTESYTGSGADWTAADTCSHRKQCSNNDNTTAGHNSDQCNDSSNW